MCASRACRWARAAARGSTTSPRGTASTTSRRASGRGIDYDIPHFLGEQQLEISVDGERVQVFTLPATPGEDLNIERQVFKAPGTGAPARAASR